MNHTDPVTALPDIDGVVHRPAADPAGVVVLTHGAGGSRDSPLLQRVCAQWADRGWLAIRYNLPYRRRRTGPPSGSGTADRAGIVEAIRLARGLADGPLIAGGHSYGGRQTSMVAASGEAALQVLTLFSYPLHRPRDRRHSSSSLHSASSPAAKPERARIEHLPELGVPTVFTHGTRDPFGSIDELRTAAALIPAPCVIVEITGARHDLVTKADLDVPALAVDAALGLL